jgi:hypothetical protein
MFPANYGTTQLLLLLFIYAGCFLLSLPLCANRHVAAAESPISFSFDFTNSSSYDGRDLRLEGDANVHGNRVSLTCNSHTSRNCTGRISYVQPVPFYHNDTGEVASFATQFTFTIVLPPLGYPKGDGMAFFLTGYNSQMPPNTEGRGLGLMNLNTGTAYGEDRFVAVEFNTYTSNETSDHIGIDVNTVKNSVKTTSLASPGLGGTMTASINFTSSSRMLVARLHFDYDPSVQPVEVSAVLPDPVTSLLPPEVAVGFSAATGVKNAELHQILSWSFNSTLAPKKPKLIGMFLLLYVLGRVCLLLHRP